MTDKEKKSKIADILMDFQEEYSNEVINRPMLASLYAGNILSFMDSLPNEPVSEELETFAKKESEAFAEREYEIDYIDRNALGKGYYWGCIDGAKWQKAKDEYITDDLGDYINELSKQFPEVSFAKLSRIAVRVAKWQKRQIIAKAVETTFNVSLSSGVYDRLWIKGCKEGDKLLVIKKDEL